jgi:hypothetical protein
VDRIPSTSARHRSDDVVRNPALALPSLQRLLELPDDTRAQIEALLRDLAHDARIRAEASWHCRKAPMATYWHVVAVYSWHIARAISPGRRRSSRLRPAVTQSGGVLVRFRQRPSA